MRGKTPNINSTSIDLLDRPKGTNRMNVSSIKVLRKMQKPKQKNLSQHILLKEYYIAMKGLHHPKVIAHILAGRSERGKHSANSGLRQGSIKDLRAQRKRHSPFLFHWLNDFTSNPNTSIESSGHPVYDEDAIPEIADHQNPFSYFYSDFVPQAQNESHLNRPQKAESTASTQPLFTHECLAPSCR